VALTVVRPATPTDPPGATGRARPGPWELAAIGIAIVVPLASAPVVDIPTWALRWSLLPALAGLGLPLLGATAWRGEARRAARWALAWLAWAAVATALAPQPVIAFWGQYRVGTGLVFFAGLAGTWAVGARAGRAARPIASALLATCALNATIGIVAQLLDLTAFGVNPFQGRAVGLYGNPVYLAELLCGGLWIALVRLDRPGRRRRVVAAGVLISAGIELSGSRAALILAVVACVVACLRGQKRTRMLGVLVVAGGIAFGGAVAAVAPGSSTGTDRVSSVAVAGDGIAPRVATWRGGVAAVVARPLWGWGPAGTLAATGPRRTLTVARAEGPEMMFADAHDLVVEAAVTTGLVGLVLLLGWMTTAVAGARRRATGEGLLGFAALVAGVSLVEPMHVGVTPLAALALGAAGLWTGPAAARRGTASAGRVAGAIVGAAGVVASAWLLAGLVALHQADLAGDPVAAEHAAARLPSWGEPDAVVGRLIAFQSIVRRDPARLDEATRWWAVAATRDAADPARWVDLGGSLEHVGRPAAAAAAYRRALRDNPWSARAYAGLVRVGPSGGVGAAETAAARAKLALLPH